MIDDKTLPDVVTTAPERIWLQVSDEGYHRDEPFPVNLDGITWCAESVLACEVSYVRTDLANASLEKAIELLRRWDAAYSAQDGTLVDTIRDARVLLAALGSQPEGSQVAPDALRAEQYRYALMEARGVISKALLK